MIEMLMNKDGNSTRLGIQHCFGCLWGLGDRSWGMGNFITSPHHKEILDANIQHPLAISACQHFALRTHPSCLRPIFKGALNDADSSHSPC